MKDLWNTIQIIFAAIGGWLGWFLGGFDGLLYALVAFVAVDYITGVMTVYGKDDYGFTFVDGTEIRL